ncbi:DctP family TRAP transporter solute-binding subunit [Ruicaihuangia caeni]|uniref:DctP family TRAP transporter solute-binding subunit n=1 Tax=Ruicaihuangia caeni TaxID=3042517 RepID=A0AAW6TA85_9MICO|nr:DctP family TRAP transporter solute-binding subunit [Klugiella sp. YN-L-19]MDI2098888.1 DctP family TRAP transporter solute-binding subunit [Klugiella sp. YN-L-19]
MSRTLNRKRTAFIATSAAIGLALTGCAAGDGGDEGDKAAATTTLTFATSFTDDHPHNRCGSFVIRDAINEQTDLGLKIDVFTNSQLGPDTERFEALKSGDIDIDLQGPSALSSMYPEIGVIDTAYAFDGPDHVFEFFDSGAAEPLTDGLREATGFRTMEPFFFGMRNFSANSAIRTPEDLAALQMRFPDSPQFLMNAEAVGATAVAVAFEEIYVALQQGIVDGQENPIPTVKSMSLDEVQTHVNLSEHQTGVQLLLINDDTWQSLTDEQRDALTEAAADARQQDHDCIVEDEQAIIDEWEESGAITVVKDVDKAAFAKKAESYFMNKYTGERLEFYKAIRESAPSN